MKKKILPLLAVVLMISGCCTSNDEKDTPVSTTGKVDIDSIKTITNDVSEKTTALTVFVNPKVYHALI